MLVSSEEEDKLPEMITASINLATIIKGKLSKFDKQLYQCRLHTIAYEDFNHVFTDKITDEVQLKMVIDFFDKFISDAPKIKIRPDGRKQRNLMGYKVALMLAKNYKKFLGIDPTTDNGRRCEYSEEIRKSPFDNLCITIKELTKDSHIRANITGSMREKAIEELGGI